MTDFVADLHIHSRFSRATSKSLTVRSLAAWAETKGIGVLGTGDCTHPGWLEEIERELVEDGDSGLFRLRDPSNLAGQIPGLPLRLSGSVRFMLEGEISSIYKRGGRVHKVHNLVFMPTLEAAKSLNARLSQVGNLASDGRPILGLDSRTLLSMVLETHPEAFLVPAHIWTPWFSLFGSMSGFNTVEECFGDLTPELFAMETGLSSDPAMNWLLSKLDRYCMISNSDAHSGEKLCREANLFRGTPSFSGIRDALRAHLTGRPGDCEFVGTVEFFPEEGKYHLDGHRKCNWSMDPAETNARKGICPVCGRPATLGVLHRVLDLADRREPKQPAGQPGYDSLIPLREVVSEILGSGPATKHVTAEYFRLMNRLGPELDILRRVPLPDVRRVSPPLAEALGRMRSGKVLRKCGFDGQYGVITVFSPEERAEFKQGLRLVAAPAQRSRRPGGKPGDVRREPQSEPEPDRRPSEKEKGPAGLNAAQTAASLAGPGPVLVIAGPGTGKTHTLLSRVLRLLQAGTPPESIAVVTFTRRAAEELRERLTERLGVEARQPFADTLHALALSLWTKRRGKPPVLLAEDAAEKLFLESLPEAAKALPKRERRALYRRWSLARERRDPMTGPDFDPIRAAAEKSAAVKTERNLADFTDLIEFLLGLVQEPGFVPPFRHLLVDEVQDLSGLQIAAVTGLAGASGAGFFAIGDPDQSIYSFRGAAGDVRERLAARWPDLQIVGLERNYRSGQGILDAAAALLPVPPHLLARADAPWNAELLQAPDDRHEAQALAARINALIGGTSLTFQESGGRQELAPGDIAVLVRTRALIAPLKKCLEQAGLPCSAPETDAFWEEPRVAVILRAAEKIYGLPAPQDAEGQDGPPPADAELPEFLLLQGPKVLPGALRERPPFDRLFWEGPAFRDLCHEYAAHGGWVGLLDWLRLETDLAAIRQAAQKVRILTLHAAKGLEFEAVFLPALEDGILPWTGGAADEPAAEALAEERRLLYVGMTRARRTLCLSWAAKRMLYGKTHDARPSRFLADLPGELFKHTVIAPHVRSRQTQLSLF